MSPDYVLLVMGTATQAIGWLIALRRSSDDLNGCGLVFLGLVLWIGAAIVWAAAHIRVVP